MIPMIDRVNAGPAAATFAEHREHKFCCVVQTVYIGCQSSQARGMWKRENVKNGRWLKATLCIKDDAWDVCMTIFCPPEFLCPFCIVQFCPPNLIARFWH